MNSANPIAALRADLKSRNWSDEQINEAVQKRIELEKTGRIKPAEQRVFLAGAGGALMDIGAGPNAAVSVYAACSEYQAMRRH